jgi:hypothetical protein
MSKQLGNCSTNATRSIASSRGTFWEKRNRMLSSKKWLLDNTGSRVFKDGKAVVGKLDPVSCLVTAEWKYWRVSDGEPSNRGSFAAVVQFLGADSGTWGQTARKFEHEELQPSQGQNELPFNLCRTVSY